VPADIEAAEQAGEQSGARIGDFVEGEARSLELGANRQQPRARRGFQHKIRRSQCRRFRRDKAERDRRRELLEVLGFFRPAGLGRQARGQARQHLEHRGR
jgi:hypothetical protein